MTLFQKHIKLHERATAALILAEASTDDDRDFYLTQYADYMEELTLKYTIRLLKNQPKDLGEFPGADHIIQLTPNALS